VGATKSHHHNDEIEGSKKMADFNWVTIEPPRRGGKSFSEDTVLFSTYVAKEGKEHRYAMAVRIPIALAEQMRWIAKDRIGFAYDSLHRAIKMSRVPQGGYSLCAIANNKGRFKIEATLCDGMPTVAETVECKHEIVKDGVILYLPQCVSFTRNLRAESMNQ